MKAAGYIDPGMFDLSEYLTLDGKLTVNQKLNKAPQNILVWERGRYEPYLSVM